MARLQAISILVYSVGPPEIVDPLIYNGLVEELVEVLEIKGTDIMVSLHLRVKGYCEVIGHLMILKSVYFAKLNYLSMVVRNCYTIIQFSIVLVQVRGAQPTTVLNLY